MANVVVTMKIMPESPDVDLKKLEEEIKKKIQNFAGAGEMKIEEHPVAFGLNALVFMFVSDEAKGSTDDLEKDIAEIKEVSSVEVTDVRRAIG